MATTPSVPDNVTAGVTPGDKSPADTRHADESPAAVGGASPTPGYREVDEMIPDVKLSNRVAAIMARRPAKAADVAKALGPYVMGTTGPELHFDEWKANNFVAEMTVEELLRDVFPEMFPVRPCDEAVRLRNWTRASTRVR